MFFELNSRRLSRNVRALVEPNGTNAKDVALMLDRFAAQLDKLFQPKTILVETPFLSVNKYGQRTSGYIDLLLETSKGGVIIDHKSFLGKRTDWPVKALSYSGQLAAIAAPVIPQRSASVDRFSEKGGSFGINQIFHPCRRVDHVTATIDLIPLR